MTFLDLLMTGPMWMQGVVLCILVIWAFEIFLFPFKFNILKNHIEKLTKLQQETLAVIQKKDEELEKTNKMLATMISLILQKEQEKEKM